MRVPTIAGLCGLAVAGPARADDPVCRTVQATVVPAADGLQIGAWIEDATGAYVDTVFVTRSVGVYGIGNRPGVMGMKSGPRWPMGPRLDVLPVWAHAHGLTFPQVIFRNGDGDPGTDLSDADRNLSHAFLMSSPEPYYNRPLRRDEPAWDIGTGSSPVFTDKGRLSPSLTSVYPPRGDLIGHSSGDDPVIDTFAALDPFDAVSGATPVAAAPFTMRLTLADGMLPGAYVLRVEVSREYDHNATYNETTQPPIPATSYTIYGLPYRGQPSVVYTVPFTITDGETEARTASYAGYGDPDGLDGALRPPDATITTTVAGSGADRLALVADPGGDYRVQVIARAQHDEVGPDAVTDLIVQDVSRGAAAVTFTGTGDDGGVGTPAGYDIRYRVMTPIDESSFAESPSARATVTEVGPSLLEARIEGLVPETMYSIGIRAYDDCGNVGPLATIEVTTDTIESGEVDACFVATAAYGTPLAGEVETLRRFRDTALRTNVVGELAVEAYYTFGPAIAGLVGESELLRATARAALAPVVDRVGGTRATNRAP